MPESLFSFRRCCVFTTAAFFCNFPFFPTFCPNGVFFVKKVKKGLNFLAAEGIIRVKRRWEVWFLKSPSGLDIQERGITFRASSKEEKDV